MLATTGTAQLSASDTRHPSYQKADDILRDVLEEFSTMELWFNTSLRTLQPNTDGKVLIPSNTITCDPVDTTKNYVIRGQYLWDNGKYTDEINESVECIVIVELDVDDLPPSAYQFIRAKARYEYYLDSDGSKSKLDNYSYLAQVKADELAIQNIRLQDINFFNSAAFIDFVTRRRGQGGRGFYSGRQDTRNQLGGSR